MSEFIEAGTLLGGRYEIVEKIGSGGMAIVYKAHCRLLNRYVAIKVLRPEFKEDAEFIRKFDVEAQAAASLSHPNIVSIYDVGREREWHYIVMELVEGVTLKQYIEKKGALPWQEAAGFAAQICSALECAHKNHIIHHDIKPHNIIITADGVAKVTDFGIARAATSSTMVVGNQTVGSVHYFSPEQARGGYTDEKSDIYSVGIVMYEMLTGRVPFNADSPVTIALMHMQNEPVAPRELKADIPEGMEQIVLRAISKEQHLRYQTAGEMLADINAVLAHRAPRDRSDGETKVVKPVGAPQNRRRQEPQPDEKKQKGGKGKKAKTPMTKNDKIAMWLAIAAGIVVLGIVGWFVLAGTGVINPGQWGEKEVPSVVGMDVEAAKESVKAQKFTIEIEEEIASATVEKGKIISQDPAAGRIVKSGTIKVKVSSGAGTVKVPKVINLEQRSAILELEAAGLVPVVTEEESETIPKGVVIRQVPDAEVEVNAGDIVRIYVSGTSADKTKVPSVIGKTLARAKTAIESAGLVVGEIDEVESDQAVGTVIKQTPSSETSVEKKTKVDLTVSIGSQKTEPPATQPPTRPPATESPATQPPQKVTTLSIPVPQNQESTHIKVVANGKTIHDDVHHKSEGAFDLLVRGTNQAQLQIYHDGVLKSTQTVTFD